ncbi:MAG TPA: bifunctional folylpolyglutamate synthase/dihydrofolate synthase, partial [Chloroflexi bacterium]|nr:bifunctional folylpolyglutamate synthase/dihydrofolate synthase [Chloroflexota bacterium]
LIATASHNPRAADPTRIVELAIARGMAAERAGDIESALDTARRLATPDDLILVTGSLYVVAEAREALGLAETPVFERALLYS